MFALQGHNKHAHRGENSKKRYTPITRLRQSPKPARKKKTKDCVEGGKSNKQIPVFLKSFSNSCSSLLSLIASPSAYSHTQQRKNNNLVQVSSSQVLILHSSQAGLVSFHYSSSKKPASSKSSWASASSSYAAGIIMGGVCGPCCLGKGLPSTPARIGIFCV